MGTAWVSGSLSGSTSDGNLYETAAPGDTATYPSLATYTTNTGCAAAALTCTAGVLSATATGQCHSAPTATAWCSTTAAGVTSCTSMTPTAFSLA